MQGCLCTDIHTGLIIRLSFPFHQASDLPELPAHFYNNTLRGASDRIHCQGSEHERQTCSDKDTNQYCRVHNTHIKNNIRSSDFLDFLNIRSDQCKSCQRG